MTDTYRGNYNWIRQRISTPRRFVNATTAFTHARARAPPAPRGEAQNQVSNLQGALEFARHRYTQLEFSFKRYRQKAERTQNQCEEDLGLANEQLEYTEELLEYTQEQLQLAREQLAFYQGQEGQNSGYRAGPSGHEEARSAHQGYAPVPPHMTAINTSASNGAIIQHNTFNVINFPSASNNDNDNGPANVNANANPTTSRRKRPKTADVLRSYRNVEAQGGRARNADRAQHPTTGQLAYPFEPFFKTPCTQNHCKHWKCNLLHDDQLEQYRDLIPTLPEYNQGSRS